MPEYSATGTASGSVGAWENEGKLEQGGASGIGDEKMREREGSRRRKGGSWKRMKEWRVLGDINWEVTWTRLMASDRADERDVENPLAFRNGP